MKTAGIELTHSLRVCKFLSGKQVGHRVSLSKWKNKYELVVPVKNFVRCLTPGTRRSEKSKFCRKRKIVQSIINSTCFYIIAIPSPTLHTRRVLISTSQSCQNLASILLFTRLRSGFPADHTLSTYRLLETSPFHRERLILTAPKPFTDYSRVDRLTIFIQVC